MLAKDQPKTMLVLGACVGAFFFFSNAASANAVLFTTQQDLTGWGDNDSGAHFTNTPIATPDSDGSSINGAANTTAPGGSGTAGSLEVIWQAAAGTYSYDYSQGEQGNQGFLNLVDPGSVANTSLAAGAGTILIDSTTPPAGGGNYFQIGLVINASGNFDQDFGTASATPNAAGFYTYTIPYTISASASLSYFQLGIIYNSNYTGTPFYIDNIQVVTVPEPASLCGLGVLGGLLLLRRRVAV